MKQTLIGPGLYELAFVVPLLLILAGVGNRQVMHRTRLAGQSLRQWMQLATGLVMTATGTIILGRFL